MRTRKRWVWGGVLVAVGVVAGDVAAQVPATSDAFVVRVGADTFAVERVVRSDGALVGEIEGRQVGRFRYRAELGEAGRVDRFGLDIWGPGAPASAPADVSRLDYSAPADSPYTAEEVRVPTAAGHVLAGALTLPADVTLPVPAAVTITGSGGQERDESVIPGYRPFRQIADTLSRRGIAVLRLDDRGVGASTGDAASATSADFADDVRAALDYLKWRPEVDSGRLALVGHSEGGLIAPLVAEEGGGVAAIVIMAGPSRPRRCSSIPWPRARPGSAGSWTTSRFPRPGSCGSRCWSCTGRRTGR